MKAIDLSSIMDLEKVLDLALQNGLNGQSGLKLRSLGSPVYYNHNESSHCFVAASELFLGLFLSAGEPDLDLDEEDDEEEELDFRL